MGVCICCLFGDFKGGGEKDIKDICGCGHHRKDHQKRF